MTSPELAQPNPTELTSKEMLRCEEYADFLVMAKIKRINLLSDTAKDRARSLSLEVRMKLAKWYQHRLGGLSTIDDKLKLATNFESHFFKAYSRATDKHVPADDEKLLTNLSTDYRRLWVYLSVVEAPVQQTSPVAGMVQDQREQALQLLPEYSI